MTNQHRATDEQQKKAPHKVEPLAAAPSAWVQLEASAHTRDIYSSCLLELRARIQQLEATQHAHITGPSGADIKAAELEWARTAPGMRSDNRILALQDQIRDGALSLADALKEIGANAEGKVVTEKDGDMIRVHEMTSILAGIGEIESLEALAYSLLHHPRFTVNPR